MCSAVAKDDMQCLRRSLQSFSAEFAPHAQAPRAKTNAKMRALGRKTCDSGKETCARLHHVCGSVVIDDAQCPRQNMRMLSADFAASTRVAPKKKKKIVLDPQFFHFFSFFFISIHFFAKRRFRKSGICDTTELVGAAQNLAFPGSAGTPRAEFLRLRVF